MASNIVGFLFTDESFFNSAVTAQDIRTLKGDLAEWFAPQLASARAAHHNLEISNCYLKEVKIGGFDEATQLGQLYQPSSQHHEHRQEEPAVTVNTNVEAEDSNKAPSTLWTHQLVLLLIETYRMHKHLFDSSCVKKVEAWKRVARDLREEGYLWVTHELCDAKFRNLKFRYKKIMDANAGSGRGRTKWEFFQVMQDLLDRDPACRPVSTVFSLTEEEYCQEGASSSFSQEPGTSTSHSPRNTPVTPRTSTSHSPSATTSHSPRATTSHSPSATTSHSPRATTSHSPRATTSQSPRTSTSSENPGTSNPSKKRKRSDEPPAWFEKFVTEHNKKFDDMKKLYEDRNEIFRDILNRMVPKNK